MQIKSVVLNQSGALPPSTVCSEQWWRGSGYGPPASTDAPANVSDSSSLDQLKGAGGSKGDLSPSSAKDDDDDTSKDSQNTGSMQQGKVPFLIVELQ